MATIAEQYLHNYDKLNWDFNKVVKSAQKKCRHSHREKSEDADTLTLHFYDASGIEFTTYSNKRVPPDIQIFTDYDQNENLEDNKMNTLENNIQLFAIDTLMTTLAENVTALKKNGHVENEFLVEVREELIDLIALLSGDGPDTVRQQLKVTVVSNILGI